MVFELIMLYTYRILAAIVVVMMAWSIWKGKDWQGQVFAAMIFVPFLLRAAGVK